MATVLHDRVRVEHRGPVTVATIAHPPANAISAAVIAGIREALEAAVASDDCRVLVITGDGERFFAAGADVSEFATSGAEGVADSGQSLTSEIEGCRLPVIAAVNGVAFGGGCEVALSCDLRVASSNARFGEPEIKLGIIPGWGGTQRLPRLIGRTAATELLLTGDPIDAERALALGLINAVVAPGELQDKVFELQAGSHRRRRSPSQPSRRRCTRESTFRSTTRSMPSGSSSWASSTRRTRTRA